MKQIVDKLNKIAKKIDESVEIPQTDLIIDSLDAITKAYGGTPNDSNLIVDKLEDIAGVAHSGITPSGNIEITENTAEGEPLDISQYATATVNVSGGGGGIPLCTATIDNTNGGQDIGISGVNDNGYIQIVPVPDGSTTSTVKLPYVVIGENVIALFNINFGMPIMLNENTWATNLVNMTISEDSMLIITDPTADSSVTLDGRVFAQN